MQRTAPDLTAEALVADKDNLHGHAQEKFGLAYYDYAVEKAYPFPRNFSKREPLTEYEGRERLIRAHTRFNPRVERKGLEPS